MNRFLLLFPLSVVMATSCLACDTVSSELGEPVRVTGESALIVWNSKTHTEQFVRSANFQTKAKNFGFLVPTPSRPVLGEADDGLFDDLEVQLQPKTEARSQTTYFWNFKAWSSHIKNHFNKAADSINTDGGGVQVVEQGRVGGYDTSVLRAGDARQLERWLGVHHYAATPDFEDWVAPYLRNGWFLTAFKIAASQVGFAQAKAVRLSFKTQAPFYPYRESKSAQRMGGGRTLRLFYIGTDRPKAHVEEGQKSRAWPVATDYSMPLEASAFKDQHIALPSGSLRLTAFTDNSSPRPGWGDLRFSPSPDQSEKATPPDIHWDDHEVYIPLDLAAFVALAGTVLWWNTRQKRAKAK